MHWRNDRGRAFRRESRPSHGRDGERSRGLGREWNREAERGVTQGVHDGPAGVCAVLPNALTST